MVPVADSLGIKMPAGHSLTLKLHFIRFRLLIVEPTILRLCGLNPGHTTHKKNTPCGVIFSGGSGWIRTSSGLSQQIYSLPRLSNSGARPNLFATFFLVACHTKPGRSVVRAEGIEPSFQAWKACILAFVLCPQQNQSLVIIY